MDIFKLKGIGIIFAIIIMLFSPSVFGILGNGQAHGEKNETLDKSDLEDRKIKLYITSTGNSVEMDLEEYICQVLLSEVPASFNIEALKAMAVASRSYVLRRGNTEEKYTKHFSCDVCDDYTHCLGYISKEDAEKMYGKEKFEENYQIIKEAVMQTKGEVLYYEDNIADTVFHASSPDKTESAKNIWGFDVPYLVSVSSGEEIQKVSVKYSLDEFDEILKKEGIVCNFSGEETSYIGEIKYNESGRVEYVEFGGRKVTGRRVREILGLKSTCFDVKYNNSTFSFEVKGSGHGVGMSQLGADHLADNGKNYEEILMHYYSGTKLGLY